MKVEIKRKQGSVGKQICLLVYILVKIAVVSCSDIKYLNDTFRNYFADTRHSDTQFISYKTKAKEFIYGEFVRFGLETEYQHFNDSSFEDATFTNVIGVKKGVNFGKQSDKILMFLAHYDTVHTTKGVDDNGAGVAAILEVARQIHEQKASREDTVLFIAPDLEEYGLVGSRHFVETLLPTWSKKYYGTSNAVRDTAHGCIVLDTVMEYNTSDNSQQVPDALQGLQSVFPEQLKSISSDNYEGDFLTLIHRKNPDATLADIFKRAWMKQGRAKYEIEQFALPIENGLPSGELLYMLGPFLRSDHRNFWEENIPAIFITDTADYRGDMKECYHSQCDNIEIMLTDENLKFLAKTADSITYTINALSKVVSTNGQSKNSPIVETVLVFVVLCSRLIF